MSIEPDGVPDNPLGWPLRRDPLGATLRTCSCDFDPDYHRQFNRARWGSDDPGCKNECDSQTSLCTPCLFGCAP